PLLTRPPPTSTLFPYTTLFRSPGYSGSRPAPPCLRTVAQGSPGTSPLRPWCRGRLAGLLRPCAYAPSGNHSSFFRSSGTSGRLRSEEHTSELQSLAYLVCRLLL